MVNHPVIEVSPQVPMTKPADFWNERYQRDDYIFGTEANDFIRAMTPYPSPGMKAFAPADGEGRNGVFLARMGYVVTSVDVSALAVDKAHKLADAHGLRSMPMWGMSLTMPRLPATMIW